MSKFNLIMGIATFGVWWVLLAILMVYKWIFVSAPVGAWRGLRNLGSYKVKRTVYYHK